MPEDEELNQVAPAEPIGMVPPPRFRKGTLSSSSAFGTKLRSMKSRGTPMITGVSCDPEGSIGQGLRPVAPRTDKKWTDWPLTPA